MAAARQQFLERGYARASLAAIAAAADVSLATVKLVGGTKAQLLVAALQGVVRGEEPDVPVSEQAWWRATLAEPTAEDIVRQFAAHAAAALEEQAGLFEVLYAAAASERELADLERRASLGRWHDFRQVIGRISELGALQPTYDVDTATDVLWALGSPQLFQMLVRRRGWSSERWQAWLRDSLTVQLLHTAAH